MFAWKTCAGVADCGSKSTREQHGVMITFVWSGSNPLNHPGWDRLKIHKEDQLPASRRKKQNKNKNSCLLLPWCFWTSVAFVNHHCLKMFFLGISLPSHGSLLVGFFLVSPDATPSFIQCQRLRDELQCWFNRPEIVLQSFSWGFSTRKTILKHDANWIGARRPSDLMILLLLRFQIDNDVLYLASHIHLNKLKSNWGAKRKLWCKWNETYTKTLSP